MKKLIIFDFDGVIVQSEELRLKIFKKIIDKNRVLISKEILFKLAGKAGKNFVDEYLNGVNQEVKYRILKDYQREYLDKIDEFIKPVKLTLNFIKNYDGNLKMAIATMNSKEMVECILCRFGIKNFFETLVTREDVLKHKPDPEIYVKTAKKVKVYPSECVVVEDTKIGAISAIAAKMDCYILLNGFNNNSDFSDVNISGFLSKMNDFKRYLT